MTYGKQIKALRAEKKRAKALQAECWAAGKDGMAATYRLKALEFDGQIRALRAAHGMKPRTPAIS